MADDDVRSILIQFLSDNELPPSLINFITEALAANKPYSQIVSELRRLSPRYAFETMSAKYLALLD